MEQPDKDETFSWRLATTIMTIATVFTIASRVLSIDPFTDVFDIFIVYLPTAVLVGNLLFKKKRPLAVDSRLTADQGPPASMVA